MTTKIVDECLRQKLAEQRRAVENARSGWRHATPHYEDAAWSLLKAEEMKLDALYKYARVGVSA